ncbi:MAG: trypsin-like serine protease [Pseudomonadota bacterium]|nr:trypsin-like serine protease [Pseudomonadota bacterium]
MPSKRHLLWTAFAATLALAACGGSSDDSPSAPQPPPPGPGPASDRIEMLDTALLRQAPADKALADAVSRLPAGAAAAQVALGPLPLVKTVAPETKGVPLKIGEDRAVPATASAAELASQLRWSTLADGAHVAAIAFTAEGANALRLGVLASQVPAGAVLRFYGAAGSPVVEITAAQVADMHEVNAQAGTTGDDARMVWGPSTDGALATLELELPAGVAPEALALAVPRLSHLMLTPEQAIEAPPRNTAHIGRAGSCNLDVTCESAFDAESRAVAKMMYTKSGSTYMCTGTLLNDTRNSQTPYLLSAAHCISEQSVASSMETYWFFRSAACNNPSRLDARTVRVTGGARLLFSNAGVDTTLMQLNSQPPANVVYAGSFFGPGVAPGVAVLGVHHPGGDLQKYSLGDVDGYGNCAASGCSTSNEANSGMVRVTWSRGTTEGGSSGSAIFAQTDAGRRYVVGALHGGTASCSNRSGVDFYGRFERSFALGIGNWLTR